MWVVPENRLSNILGKNLRFYLKKNPKPEDFKVLPTAEKNHVFWKMNTIDKHRFCFVDKSSQNIETSNRSEAFDLMVFLKVEGATYFVGYIH